MYRALVVSASDPQSLGRIRVQCPKLYGTNLSDWIEASSTTPAEPDVGATVWILLENEDMTKPIWLSW